MADRKIEIQDEEGRITISDDVIAAIARFATEKVPGAARPVRTSGLGIMGLFGGEDLSPNIKTELDEKGVHLELRIVVEYGYPVHEVARGVQAAVRADMAEIAAIPVTGVDVLVRKVIPPQMPRRGAND
jgi:uncharacterized alkaline shock family protein YloU